MHRLAKGLMWSYEFGRSSACTGLADGAAEFEGVGKKRLLVCSEMARAKPIHGLCLSAFAVVQLCIVVKSHPQALIYRGITVQTRRSAYQLGGRLNIHDWRPLLK